MKFCFNKNNTNNGRFCFWKKSASVTKAAESHISCNDKSSNEGIELSNYEPELKRRLKFHSVPLLYESCPFSTGKFIKDKYSFKVCSTKTTFLKFHVYIQHKLPEYLFLGTHVSQPIHTETHKNFHTFKCHTSPQLPVTILFRMGICSAANNTHYMKHFTF